MAGQFICPAVVVGRLSGGCFWRQTDFVFEKFKGNGEVAGQFTLSAEYWEEPEDRYTENSDFTYQDEKNTMQE